MGEAPTSSYTEGLEEILQFISEGVRVVRGYLLFGSKHVPMPSMLQDCGSAPRGVCPWDSGQHAPRMPAAGHTDIQGTARVFGHKDWWFFLSILPCLSTLNCKCRRDILVFIAVKKSTSDLSVQFIMKLQTQVVSPAQLL